MDGEEPTDALEELFNVKELFKVCMQIRNPYNYVVVVSYICTYIQAFFIHNYSISQVVAQPDIDSDDAFILEKVSTRLIVFSFDFLLKVDNSLVAEFNYVAGVTMVLTNQLHQVCAQNLHACVCIYIKPVANSCRVVRWSHEIVVPYS